jgi:hypothetical protein
MSRPTFFFAIAALAAIAGCVPSYAPTDGAVDAGPGEAGSVRDGASPNDAGPQHDAGMPEDTGPASEGGPINDGAPADADAHVDAEAGPPPVAFPVLLAPTFVPGPKSSDTMPYETHTVWVQRTPGHATLLLAPAATIDGNDLAVDDNIHVIVQPRGGVAVDQYYGFWAAQFSCPNPGNPWPPSGSGGGTSPPINVSAMFSNDTTIPQKVTLEFWHCTASGHDPQEHTAVYLIEP